MKKYRFDYFASCPTGIENLVAQELKEFGAKNYEITRGGVRFEAFHEVALKAILFSRFASRIFKFLYRFDVLHEKDLYHKASELKWKSLLTSDQTFKIHCLYGHLPRERNEFKNSLFTTLKLKDSIVDYFKFFDKKRPSIDKVSPQISFMLRIDSPSLSSVQAKEARSLHQSEPYQATLLLDLCGSPLHQRGYRVSAGEAPLKENLAAAIIKLVEWKSNEESIIDGMTGSGTLAIEAALMAGDIPPSFLKVERYLSGESSHPWIFLHSQWFQKDPHLQSHFQTYLTEIQNMTQTGLDGLKTKKIKFLANELSATHLDCALENITSAKLQNVIHLSKENALHLSPVDSSKSLFICNPPYGERLESEDFESLKNLYQGLGDLWKKSFKNHRAALLTGRKELLKSVGLKTKRKHALFNGDIECRLAEYELY